MRVHNVLTSVLVTGMLNFNVVLGQNEVARAILMTSDNLGIFHDGLLNFYVDQFSMPLRPSCAKDYEMWWSAEDATVGQTVTARCFSPAMNSTRPSAAWYWLLNDAAAVDAYVENYCTEIASIRACLSDFAQSGEQCLTPAEREVANAVGNIIFSALEFVCENDGKRLKDLVATKSMDCVISTSLDLTACQRPPKLNYDILFGNSCADLTIKQYAEFKKLQRCTVAVLRTCKDQSMANFIDDLANTWSAISMTPSTKFGSMQYPIDE